MILVCRLKKIHKVLLMLLGIIVMTVAGFKAMQPKEPEYQGRKLSEWMVDFDKDENQSKQAVEALRAMGPSIIPRLVEQVTSESPGWKLKLRQISFKLGYKDFGNTSEEINQVRAFWALAFLEKDALSAIPVLVTKLGEGETENTSIQLLLINMGSASVPELIKALESGSDVLRFRAIDILRMIGEDASEAVPALAKIRRDSRFRQEADIAMRQIGQKTAEDPKNPKLP